MKTNRISIVIGTGFGDEGKGLTTSYLSSLDPDNSIVVRFSGGHNAGHTVVNGEERHVFSSFGSGSLHDVPTFWSRFCTFNPTAVVNEYNALKMIGKAPRLFVDPFCPVTTPYDIKWNQTIETMQKHGSVGVGLGATFERHDSHYRLHMIDLLYPSVLEQKLKHIAKYYGGVDADLTQFLEDCKEVKSIIYCCNPLDSLGFEHVIFEGSQGLLLDQEFGFFPHVTRSHTSSKNAMLLMQENKLDVLPDMYYITRSYQTRHGNGPMSNEGRPVKLVNNENETNVSGDWQGNFRTGMLDVDMLAYAISCDVSKYAKSVASRNLVVTCLDQTGDIFPVTKSNGQLTLEINAKELGNMIHVRMDFIRTSDGPDSKNLKLIL